MFGWFKRLRKKKKVGHIGHPSTPVTRSTEEIIEDINASLAQRARDCGIGFYQRGEVSRETTQSIRNKEE